jgi:biopolymer transport protein ExbD
MAGIDVGGGGAKRATNSDINMIPFIDLLMVTIAFLLITAVWTTNSRISANAENASSEPRPMTDPPPPPEKVLNLHVAEGQFGLVWKHGATVVSEIKVPRAPVAVGEGADKTVRYPDLAKTIEREWQQQGGHRDRSDRKQDTAVLHSDNRVPFRELVAVLDALNATQREMAFPDGSARQVPVFNMAFSSR